MSGRPRRTPTITLAALLPGLLPGVLTAGCGYSANVRNASRHTVVAEINHDRFLADTTTRDSARLEPGASASFGPFKIDPLEPIHLRVRTEGDVFGGWQDERLEPGENSFVVEDGTLESWEAVDIRRE